MAINWLWRACFTPQTGRWLTADRTRDARGSLVGYVYISAGLYCKLFVARNYNLDGNLQLQLPISLLPPLHPSSRKYPMGREILSCEKGYKPRCFPFDPPASEWSSDRPLCKATCVSIVQGVYVHEYIIIDYYSKRSSLLIDTGPI